MTTSELVDLRTFIGERDWYQSVDIGPYRTPGKHDGRALLNKLGWPPFDLRDGTFLDLGCFSGADLYEAGARGARLAVGMERHDKRFQLAREVLEWKLRLRDPEAACVRLLRADLGEARAELGRAGLPLQFDLVHMLSVLHHLRQPRGGLREAFAVTGRTLLLEVQVTPPPEHVGERHMWQALPEVIPTSVRPRDVFLSLEGVVEAVRETGSWRSVDVLGAGKWGHRKVLICER